MRRGLEKLFDSYVTGSGGFGPLYAKQVWRGSNLVDEANMNPSFADFVGTKYSQQYLAKPTMTKDLANLAKLTFKDIKGTEWYANLIPMSVYYGVVNGYEDGTFRGNNAVTRAEFASMFGSYLGRTSSNSNYDSIYGKKWYSGSLHNLEASVLPPDVLNKTTISQEMTRGEVAVVLASYLTAKDKVTFTDSIRNGSIKSYPFKDVKGYTTDVFEDYMNDKIGLDAFHSAYTNKCKNVSKPPVEVLAAMLALEKNGIMSGDSQGNSLWNQPVTRAQVLSFLQKAEMRTSALTR